MVKMQIKYENDMEKLKILEALKGVKVKSISKPLRTGKYYRIYVHIE